MDATVHVDRNQADAPDDEFPDLGDVCTQRDHSNRPVGDSVS